MKYFVQGVFNQGIDQTIYAGIFGILPSEEALGFQGSMMDEYGRSLLSEIEVTETSFQFTKQYRDRSDLIQYTFSKGEDGFWYGQYKGKAVGRNVSRCVLTQVPEDFFEATLR